MMSEEASSGKGMKATTMSKPELLTVARESLKSLIWQWFLCFSIWVAMLLITRGSPSPTEIGICCVVSFSVVAFTEFTNSSHNDNKIKNSISALRDRLTFNQRLDDLKRPLISMISTISMFSAVVVTTTILEAAKRLKKKKHN